MIRPRLLALALILAAPGVSSADYVPADLRTYNLVASGNVSVGADIYGRVIVGGNTSGGTGPLTGRLQNDQGFNNVDTLIVGGSVQNPIQIYNGNAVVSSASSGSNVNRSGTGAIVVDAPGSANQLTHLASTLSTLMNNASANLAALPGQAVADPTADGNFAVTTNAGNTHNGVAVFTLDAAFFSDPHIQQFDINNNAGATSIIFNVSGTSVTVPGGFKFGNTFNNTPSLRQITMFNFSQADDSVAGQGRVSIGSGSEFMASVLAPNATVSNSIPIDGVLLTHNFLQGGELHLPYENFYGNSPDDPSKPLYSGTLPTGRAVPEPGSMALLAIGGLGGLAVFRRKRAKPAA